MTRRDGGNPVAEHEAATNRIWQLIDEQARAIVVNSPPGAGKSTLVQRTAQRLAPSRQVPIITQTNDQADDLVRALARRLARTSLSVGRLHRSERYTPPPGIPASNKIEDLEECQIVVAPADKWAFVEEDYDWDIGIIDEAYQVSSAHLVRIAARFARLVLVGDPGQLSPFSPVEEAALRATGSWPLATAAGTVLRTHPDTPIVELPVSWRLPDSGARVVADSFYAKPFTAGTTPGERGLWAPIRPAREGHLDRVLDTVIDHGWCLLELPEARLPRTDPECVDAIVDVVRHLLVSRTHVIDGDARRLLRPNDIAIGVAHRDQRERIRSEIDEMCATLGIARNEITVDTANRLQGRQFEVVVAWHPLSGRRDASAFHLEAGRLCVLASRHRQACIVVARAGIREQLDAYPHTEPVWLGAAPPDVDGWEANHAFLEHLEKTTVRIHP
ncbi:AAA family ATPase [Micromonospora aurantiaca (nom. illeg.)]|uniref:AAA family ATPase n=1 Tax=Micromonospora aurantiaca (nom. illeg.) TaxID=47850 RepID=UPI0008282F57|nr:AAA family ATPase [Micromonospora aurantiaca]SCL36172.1 AAA domain-containing protein [Micromonospora aurantiaca]